MPRKSRQLRLDQATSLSAEWEKSVFNDDYRHRFIRDMINRLTRERGTSTKQRNWLDTLIEEGVPVHDNINAALTSKMDKIIAAFAAAGEAYSWELNVLKDMRNRVALNRPMSEKQGSLIQRLMDEGKELAEGNHWSPSDEVVEDLRLATKLYNGYASLWKQDRPAVRRCWMEVHDWLEATSEEDNRVLKKNSADRLLKAVNGKLKKVKSPRFKTGDIGKVSAFGADNSIELFRVVCMSSAYVTETGRIVNDWLMPTGELKAFDAESVAKR